MMTQPDPSSGDTDRPSGAASVDALARLREQLEQLHRHVRDTHDLEAALEASRAQELCLRQRLESGQRELQRYRELFDFAPIPVLALNRGGIITSCNLSAATLLGKPRGHIEGWPLQAFVDKDSHADLLSHLRECRNAEHAARTELTLQTPDGDALPVEIHSHRRTGDGGHFLTTLIDITERRRADSERQRLAEIEASARARDQFLATLSHELRAPLSPIANLVAVLKMRHDLPENVRPMIEMIERNLWLEVRLVDDLLDTTRIARNKLSLEMYALDLHDVAREAAETIAERFCKSGISLQLELNAAVTKANGDPARLLQVLWNLLGNAAKFTPSGGRVTVRSRNPVPGRIEISVEDSGIGIPADRIGNIFAPFEQVQDSHQGGLGLGLAIANGVIDAHGGSIEVRSDGPDRGSVFSVTLATLADHADDGAADEPAR